MENFLLVLNESRVETIDNRVGVAADYVNCHIVGQVTGGVSEKLFGCGTYLSCPQIGPSTAIGMNLSSNIDAEHFSMKGDLSESE